MFVLNLKVSWKFDKTLKSECFFSLADKILLFKVQSSLNNITLPATLLPRDGDI